MPKVGEGHMGTHALHLHRVRAFLKGIMLTSVDVHAKILPRAILEGMLLPQLIENICGIKA